MILKLMAQNIKQGGHVNDSNQPDDRWQLIVERVRSQKPDFLLLCEVVNWDQDGHRDVADAMTDFDMLAMPIAPSPSGYPTLLMYNPRTVGTWKHWNPDTGDQAMHGFGVSAFDVGLPDLLTVTPVHLAPYSCDRALEETALISTRAYRYGRYAILGGDFNFPSSRGPEPNFADMKPVNIQSRTVMTDPTKNEPLRSDRRVGWKMEQAGYIDAAWEMFERTGDNDLLKGTGSTDRIDQFWVSEPLKPALVSYQRIDDAPGKKRVSDHAGIVIEIDTDKVDLDYHWPGSDSWSSDDYQPGEHRL